MCNGLVIIFLDSYALTNTFLSPLIFSHENFPLCPTTGRTEQSGASLGVGSLSLAREEIKLLSPRLNNFLPV